MKTLTYWLQKYYKMQNEILLCYRKTAQSSWGDRTFYLEDDYDAAKPYNHRSVLKNEVVIEFDVDDKAKNLEMTDRVCERLDKDGIKYAVWSSGNRSNHIHFFVDTGEASNLNTLKRTIIKHYTYEIGDADLAMASDNHLIRAELGLNEKTGKYKTLTKIKPGFPFVNIINPKIWDRYVSKMEQLVQRTTTIKVNELVDHPGLKWILSAEEFRKTDDGRERALFLLIHVLKPQYQDNKEGLVKYLQNWYKYSSGRTLTDYDIQNKVNYHFGRTYEFSDRYINDLCTELGRKDLVRIYDPQQKLEVTTSEEIKQEESKAI